MDHNFEKASIEKKNVISAETEFSLYSDFCAKALRYDFFSVRSGGGRA